MGAHLSRASGRAAAPPPSLVGCSRPDRRQAVDPARTPGRRCGRPVSRHALRQRRLEPCGVRRARVHSLGLSAARRIRSRAISRARCGAARRCPRPAEAGRCCLLRRIDDAGRRLRGRGPGHRHARAGERGEQVGRGLGCARDDTPPVQARPGLLAVRIARRYLGVPYVFGGASPSGFDSSGLTMYVYAHLGVALEHGAKVQREASRPVPRQQAEARRPCLLRRRQLLASRRHLRRERQDDRRTAHRRPS